MRVSSSVKFVAATWLAALIAALAGHSLAEASATSNSERASATIEGASVTTDGASSTTVGAGATTVAAGARSH